MRSSRIVYAGAVLTCIIALTYWAYQRSNDVEPIAPTAVDLSEPATQDYVYESERGGFSVLVPRGWRVAERADQYTFEVVVYPGHYGDKVPESFSTRAHVSIFPYGLGSGGQIPWRSATSSVVNPNDGASALAYVTPTGEPWGWTLAFSELTEGSAWKQWGIVYASLDMIQDEPVCFDAKDVVKEMRECDPLSGDRVVRDGRINRADEAALLRIIRSVDVK